MVLIEIQIGYGNVTPRVRGAGLFNRSNSYNNEEEVFVGCLDSCVRSVGGYNGVPSRRRAGYLDNPGE